MRRKRKKATAAVVDGVVHAIGDTKQASAFQSAHDEPRDSAWGAWGAYPLPRRMTRAQRKAEKAKQLKDRTDPLVRLMCEPRYTWRSAPRTRASVNCMTCIVVAARTGA
jgi:hypothetical protein